MSAAGLWPTYAERLELGMAAMARAKARVPRRVRAVPAAGGMRVDVLRLESWGPFSGALYGWRACAWLEVAPCTWCGGGPGSASCGAPAHARLEAVR